MGSIDLGAKAIVTWPTAPLTGSPALAVTRPDGIAVSPAPVVAGAGETTQAEFVPSMPGRYALSWSVAGDAAYTDVLDVWPADPRFLIPLKEASTGLSWPTNTPVERSEDLRLYVAAATPVIEDITGPLLARQEHLSAWGDSSAVLLPGKPSAVLSVVVNGDPVSDYFPDLGAGILYAGSRLSPSRFAPGEVVVTYTVGAAEIAPNIRLAVRELVRHWWQIGMQANGGSIRGSAPDGDVFTPSGYAVPRRVIELCAPDQKVGGFA